MKIKELIAQLSAYDGEAEVELMYSFHTSSVINEEDINHRLIEKLFYVVPHVGNFDKMNVSSILLATSNSLIGN